MRRLLFVCLLCQLPALAFAPSSNPRLIYADRNDIRMISTANPKKPNVTILIDGLEDAIALDFYYQGHLLFWTDVHEQKIKRTRINDTNRKAEDVISVGLRRPEGLAVDWVTKKLYWTDLRDADGETNRIEVSNLDGSQRKVLFWENLEQPRAIALDPLSGFMFWSDWGENAKIEKAGMDGSHRTTIVSSRIHWPNGLTVDYDTRNIYWTDANLHYIARAEYDGSKRETVLEGPILLSHPFALSVYESVVYWTDWKGKAVLSCNKKNGKNMKYVMTSIMSPMDIHVYEANRQRSPPRAQNPCASRNGDCSHLCLLAPQGQKTCACPTGVRLKKDGKNCEKGPKNFLMLARRVDIRRISLDTPDYTDVVLPISSIRHAVAIDYDASEKYVYWTDDEERCINRAKLNGASQLVVEKLVTTEIQHPDGVAVDWIARNLYWTDTGTDRIEVSRLNGSSRKVLLSEDISEPRAIALHPQRGYMYWTDWGKHPKIERADLDGGNRRVLVNQSIFWPNGLCIDYEEDKLYWVDAKLDKIVVMDMDGNNQRILLSKNLPHVFGFTLLGDRLYWTDWQSRFLETVNKTTGGNRKKIVEQLPDLMGLKAVSVDQNPGTNACQHKNAGCSHLCLYTPQGPRCACPTGLEIKADRKTCTVAEAFLLFSKRTDIRRISLNLHNGDRPIPLVGIKEALALDFHVARMHIYWSDGELKAISRACLNGSSYERVVEVDLDYPDGIAVDWIAGNLYWTDAGKHRIEVARLDGAHRKTLIWHELFEPRSLALDPVNGTLYWTNGGKFPSIWKADMDGTNRVKIVGNLKRPNGLSIDFKARLLFWVDADTNMIECANLDGTRRRKVAGSLPKPFALTLFDDYMYWTDWKKESIERANKTNGKNRTTIQRQVESATDIQAYHASKQEGWNACADNNAGCSHLCLSKPRQQVVCSCSNHFELNKADNKTCEAPKAFLLFSSKNAIRRMLFESADRLDVFLPIRNLNDVLAIDYDVVDDIVYWIDGATNTIRGAFQNGTNVTVVISGTGVEPFDLAIDSYGRQLFWTDRARNTINVYSLKRKESIGVVVERKGEFPRSIVLYPERGQMYWTDNDPAGTPRIFRAGMDGDGPLALISSDLRNPGDLAIDKKGQKLYWTDIEHKRIEYADLEKGSNRAILVDLNLLNPSGLAVHGNFVYWVDKNSRNVERTLKTDQNHRKPVQAQIDDLSDLVVVDKTELDVNHPCQDNDCTHICVSRRGQRHCSCPQEMILNSNNRTCGDPPTCSADEFRCSDGHCIHQVWVCDGRRDCSNDEDVCHICQPGYWSCRNGSGCIEDSRKCDDIPDCPDGSDEAIGDPCRPACQKGETHCADGYGCYAVRWRCDGHNDCEDASDERDCSYNGTMTAPPVAYRSTLNTQMVGGIVASIVICIVICVLAVLIWWRIKRGPGYAPSSHEIGLVVTPVLHAPPPSRASSSSSSRGSLCSSALARKSTCPAGSSKYLKSICSGSNRTGTGTSRALYDRNNITGASCSSTASTVVSAYPREPLNPPPSPVTERSQYTTRSAHDYCESLISPSSCASHRYHRPRMPPPPSLASGFDSASERHRSRRPHRCRSKRHPASVCTDVAYESDLFAPPPTPNTNYLSEATHYSDQECPPSPTTTERSCFNPYPPPPSPVTDTPSLV